MVHYVMNYSNSILSEKHTHYMRIQHGFIHDLNRYSVQTQLKWRVKHSRCQRLSLYLLLFCIFLQCLWSSPVYSGPVCSIHRCSCIIDYIFFFFLFFRMLLFAVVVITSFCRNICIYFFFRNLCASASAAVLISFVILHFILYLFILVFFFVRFLVFHSNVVWLNFSS